MFAYCLADFFNLSLWPSGRPPGYPDVRDGLADLVSASLEAAPSAREVTYRLYGGWNGEVPETRVALRELTERAVRHTPKRIASTRLRFQLAEAPLWDSSLRLLRTVRKIRHSHIAATLSASENCPQHEDCSFDYLKQWCGGSCPETDCPVSLAEVASGFHQKMVDTLLTADALTIARDALAQLVMIASDDEDMVPAMLALKESEVDTIHLTRRGGYPVYYSEILIRDGVAIYGW